MRAPDGNVFIFGRLSWTVAPPQRDDLVEGMPDDAQSSSDISPVGIGFLRDNFMRATRRAHVHLFFLTNSVGRSVAILPQGIAAPNLPNAFRAEIACHVSFLFQP